MTAKKKEIAVVQETEEVQDPGVALVTAAESFKSGVSTLRKLAELVPSMPTEKLGKGYAMIKAFDTEYKDVVESIRNEFIGTQTENGVYNEDGRLFTEPTGEDDKGNKVILFPDKTMLKASKSIKATFDSEKATIVLKKHNLVKQGSNENITVVDMKGLMGYINKLIDYVPDEEKLALTTEVSQYINREFTPDEAKIEALLVLGKLPQDEVDVLMNSKTGYSLLVSKNPYKPKKK